MINKKISGGSTGWPTDLPTSFLPQDEFPIDEFLIFLDKGIWYTCSPNPLYVSALHRDWVSSFYLFLDSMSTIEFMTSPCFNQAMLDEMKWLLKKSMALWNRSTYLPQKTSVSCQSVYHEGWNMWQYLLVQSSLGDQRRYSNLWIQLSRHLCQDYFCASLSNNGC